jgi:hypothetical protein
MTSKQVRQYKKARVSRPVDGLVGPLPCPFCGSDNAGGEA